MINYHLDKEVAGTEMNSSPLVSVLVPSYTHSQFIVDTLNSVLNCNYPNIELIIIDDGSNDDSVKVISEWVDENKAKINIIFKSRENKGLPATLNELLALAKGKYYVPVASDDYLLPNGIHKRVEFLDNNKDLAAVFSDAMVVDNYNNKIFDSAIEELYKGSKCKMAENLSVELILFWCVPGPVFLANTEYIKSIGGYNEKIKVEDRYMYLKLLSKNKLGFIDDLVAAYRWHPVNSVKVSSKSIMEGVLYSEKSMLSEFKGKEKLALKYSIYIHHLKLNFETMNDFERFYYRKVSNILLEKLNSKMAIKYEKELREMKNRHSFKMTQFRKNEYDLSPESCGVVFNKCITNVKKSSTNQNSDNVIFHLSIASRYAYEFDLNQEQYFDFQKSIKDISNYILNEKKEQPNKSSNLRKGEVLHIATEINELDEFSEKLLNWISEDEELQNHLLLTNLSFKDYPNNLINNYEKRFRIMSTGMLSNVERVKHIIKTVDKYATIILHIHPSDIHTYIALANINKPLILLDYKSKKIWIGNDITKVFNEIRYFDYNVDLKLIDCKLREHVESFLL